MPVDHYENFPVASLLLPRRLRPAVEAIYRFARSADDIADEGIAAPAERLAALDRYGAQLHRLEAGQSTGEPLFDALGEAISRHALPFAPFHDLLSAFAQDVVKPRYASYVELLDYCTRSANPVGRLMLHLFEAADPRNLRDADAICTALQLINFWQDVRVDLGKGRIYLPQDDLARFGVTEGDIAMERAHLPAWRFLMRFQVERAQAMLESGAPLATRLPGRIGWELRLVVQGGARILERIAGAGYDVFHHRPTLRPLDWLPMLRRAAGMTRTAP